MPETKPNFLTKKTTIGIALIALLVCTILIWNSTRHKEIKCLSNRTEIYENFKDAVVLVKHTYKFNVSIKGCEPFELQIENNGLNSETITGTGFFISKNGKIATNHHVAEPWLYEKNKEWSQDFVKNRISELLPDSIAPENYKKYLEEYWDNYEDGEDYEEEQTNDTTHHTNSATIDSLQNTKPIEPIKYVSYEDINIIPQSVEISIALHGSNDKWLMCEIVSVSDDPDVDVAILQLSNKKTPHSVTNIIDLSNAITNDESVKPGSNAILIGYPMGMELANTRRGIKVQIYEGQINKESDGVSLQYNVTSTHGASGSPVFNECGQLIAINYAGYDVAQGYNFGIVAKHVQDLAE